MKTALLISCFEEWYRMRLMPICKLLEQKGYKTICALSDYNHISKRYSHKEETKCTYIHVSSNKSNISPQRVLSHMVFGKKIKELIEDTKPDFVYLLVPPNNTAKQCVRYKKEYPGVKFIVDIIDLWPESMPLGGLKNTPPAKVWRNWRNNAIKEADYVFTECDLYQDKLSDVINHA